MFNGRFTGCTPDTGVEIPDFEKVSYAFGIPYVRIENHKELIEGLEKVYATEGAVVCELYQDKEQAIEPRVMSRKLNDGTLVSPVIDDLYPFLDKQTYESMKYENYVAEADK